MMPPPAPARPLISASDIPPPLLPASPGRRITGASRAKQDSTPPPPNRVASAAACYARSVSLDCGRRKRGGGGVESTRALGSALGSARRVPLRCRAFRWSSEFRPLQLTLTVPCARRPVPCDLIPTSPPGPVLKCSPPSTHAFLMASCPSTTGSQQRSAAHHLTCSLNFESGFRWEEFAKYLTAWQLARCGESAAEYVSRCKTGERWRIGVRCRLRRRIVMVAAKWVSMQLGLTSSWCLDSGVV
jgi:hypothetical protein